MNKNKLVQIRKKLISLGLVGVMLGTVGCRDEHEEPKRISISEEYYNIDEYYKYVVQNGEAVKLYNSQNVYLLYNKENYEINEYIYKDQVTFFGGAELYDLETEEMLVYGNGIATTYNEEFFKYIIENNYQVCLADIEDYIEDHSKKDYYSLDEIKELEPQIEKSLRIINKSMVKTQ